MASAPFPTPDVRPKSWERQVAYAFLRMMGHTQVSAASAVGRKRRVAQLWEADKARYEQAREEARRRWVRETTDLARQSLHKALQGTDGDLALKVLERLDSDLAPPTQRVKLHHEVGAGLSGLLEARRGGAHAQPD